MMYVPTIQKTKSSNTVGKWYYNTGTHRRPLLKESPTPNLGGGVFEKINYKSIK
jgi:hypothetical protein